MRRHLDGGAGRSEDGEQVLHLRDRQAMVSGSELDSASRSILAIPPVAVSVRLAVRIE